MRCRRTRPRREFGINENLAREILELHTLGVNGGYSQHDVTSFAQIITGWSIGGGKGRLAGGTPGRFYFRDNLHERYLAGELVVFNAVASPYRDRSHFDGQNVLESMASPQSGVRTAAVDRVSGITHMAATLMRSDGGPEVAVIEASGWDTHANQGAPKGPSRGASPVSTARYACWRMSWDLCGRKPRFWSSQSSVARLP